MCTITHSKLTPTNLSFTSKRQDYTEEHYEIPISEIMEIEILQEELSDSGLSAKETAETLMENQEDFQVMELLNQYRIL